MRCECLKATEGMAEERNGKYMTENCAGKFDCCDLNTVGWYLPWCL
jgi:hypothetical protein